MRIEHQAPLADMAFKLTAPLRIVLKDQQILTAKGWTLSDIELDDLTLDQEQVDLIVPFQGVDLRFPIKLEETGQAGVYSLKNLTGRQREILALFYRGILSGRMASADDMITSLDTPTDLVPMEQSEDEAKPSAPKAVRLTKVLSNLVLYSVLALVMVFTAGSLVWDRVTMVPLQHARVVAPVIPHLVATPGYVTEILVQPGDHVKQGDRLVSVGLPDADANVEDIRRDRKTVEDKIKALQEQRDEILSAHMQKQAILEGKYRNAVSQRRVLDFLGGYDLRQSIQTYMRWQAAMIVKPNANLEKLNDQIAQQMDELRRIRRDLGHAKDAAGAADIFAKVTGTVQEIPVYENQFLHRSQMAVIVEEATDRTIQAWLPEGRLDAVHPGMPVQLDVMGQGGRKKLVGSIASITGARNAAVNDTFGLQIEISVAAVDLAENRSLLLADAPVTAKALRPLGAAVAGGN